MSEVIFIDAYGEEVRVTPTTEANLMQLAVNSQVRGIEAECGGCCSCATCHVELSQEQFSQLTSASEDEAGLLEFVPNSTATSRLACQIPIDDKIDNLTFIVKL
jgi:2Fe-2S ferredoxin